MRKGNNYRNINDVESLWVNHTVAYNASQDLPTGIRWYEIRNPSGTPFVYQQGTFQPDDGHSRWMGSLAVRLTFRRAARILTIVAMLHALTLRILAV